MKLEKHLYRIPLILAVLSMLLTSCADVDTTLTTSAPAETSSVQTSVPTVPEVTIDASDPSVDETVEASAPSAGETVESSAPISFTWNPAVLSDYQRRGLEQQWGPEMEQAYYDCVDALLAGKETVAYENEEITWSLMPLLQTNFPVSNALVYDFFYEDGALHFIYGPSPDEREQIIEQFSRQIETHITTAVCQDDTPTMAAVALYHSFVTGLQYDDDAAASEEIVDVSPYRALMTGEGICQSFGPAYAYLCMQLGINAVDAGGLDMYSENAHSWTMLELNGCHYFADPTFESSEDHYGLIHFGMTGERRMAIGSFPLDQINLGYNLMWASEFDMSDDRFAPLWQIRDVQEILRTPDGMVIRGLSDGQGQDVIPIEDGKTLTVIHLSAEQTP